MKKCNKCELDKPDEDFYLMKRRGKEYLYHICKPCNRDKNKELKEYGRDWELKKKYGISLEEYRKECEKRGNICDICSVITDTMHVDHNHITGKVRGFLCGSCNRGIGLLKDSPEILDKASHYLRTHD